MRRKKHQREEEVEAIDFGDAMLVELVANALGDVWFEAFVDSTIACEELVIGGMDILAKAAIDKVRHWDRHRYVARGQK